MNKLHSPGNPPTLPSLLPDDDPFMPAKRRCLCFQHPVPPWTRGRSSSFLFPFSPMLVSSTRMSDSADVYVCCGWCSDTELLEESYSLYGVKPPGRPPSGPPRSPFPAGAAPPLPPGGQGYDATRYCTHVSHTHTTRASPACLSCVERLPACGRKKKNKWEEKK